MLILLTSILAIAQPVESTESKHSDLLPLFSPFPLERLTYRFLNFYPLDFELIFMYIERNLINQSDFPNVFGSSSCFSADPLIEENIPYTEPLSQCCTTPPERVGSTLFLRHIEPGGIGYSNGYTTLQALFFPGYCHWTKWPFLDLRLHYFNNNEWAGNVGLGTRLFSCPNIAYGFNSYFDFRIHDGIFFPQVGVGLERLGPCWELRLNGYIPIKQKKIEKETHFTYPGGFFFRCAEYRNTLMGCDMEIGRNFCFCDCIRFYTGIGPYYYGKVQCNDAIYGGRFRSVLDLSCYFSLEGIVTYDNHYKTRVQGGISINFPFGCGSCQTYLSQPVWRNEIIPFRKSRQWHSNF